MPFILTVSEKFDAAHYLPGYQGPCSKMHGHTWKVKADFLFDSTNELGLCYDFKDLKTTLKEYLKYLDHNVLNELFPIPSAEIIAKAIFDWLKEEKLPVLSVTVFESETAYATYFDEENEIFSEENENK